VTRTEMADRGRNPSIRTIGGVASRHNVRPDLDIALGIINTIYALPDALCRP